MAARTAGRKGRPWRRIRLQVLKDHRGVCHICLHPGARQVDHTPPRKTLVRLGLDPNNPRYLRPAHGNGGNTRNPCPTCGRNCNQRKGTKSAVVEARPLITSRPW